MGSCRFADCPAVFFWKQRGNAEPAGRQRAAAAAVVKGAKEQDMSQALLGKEQSKESEAELKNLQPQLSEAKNKWGEAEGDLAILNAKRTGGKGNTKAALDEKKKAKMTRSKKS